MQLEACMCPIEICIVSDDYQCDTFIGNKTLMFNEPRRVRFENLNIGTLYKASIWGVNLNGTGPVAGIDIIRLSGPPKEPQDCASSPS